MAIGIVSDSEFDAEVNSVVISNEHKPDVARGFHVPSAEFSQVMEILPNRGRGNTTEVPEAIRSLAAEEVINGTSAREASKLFGVSESSIAAYKHSAHSTSSYNSPVASLLNKNTRVKEIIGNKSRRILLKALNNITDEKLSKTKASELSNIAKSMSSIVLDMQPVVPVEGNKVVNQVIVFKPRTKDEDEFEVLEVGE